MKTNVQPGMLAYVVPLPGTPVITPEILGRVVYVERTAKQDHVYRHIDGRLMANTLIETAPTWIVSAKDPLPGRVALPGEAVEIWYMHERPILDACLRPLLDPNLDISDEEVKELYSPKKEECVV